MKKLLLFTIILIALYGCHTSAGVSRALETWNGSNKSQVIAIHGAPSSIYDVGDGSHIVIFFVKKCKIQFFVDRNNIITGSTWDGCYKASTIKNWSNPNPKRYEQN
jgi:hypothetical protein